MTNEKTDNTDEPTKAELHDRVQQLESTVEKLMPSRRDALRMGAAGLAGAVGLSATTQPADASTGSAGDIGEPNNRPDLFADSVDANQLTGSAGFIKTKTRAFLINDSSADPVPLDATTYDPDGNFDTTAHAYTVPATGTYLIAFQGRSDNLTSSGSRLQLDLKQNGSSIITSEVNAEGEFATTSATDIRELATGDSITLGNPKSQTVNKGENSTFLSISRLE